MRTRWVALLVLFSAGGIMAAEPGADDADMLRAAGVLPTPEGLASYLRSLAPSKERDQKAEQLIEQLGSAKFREREDASAALVAMLPLPVEEIRGLSIRLILKFAFGPHEFSLATNAIGACLLKKRRSV